MSCCDYRVHFQFRQLIGDIRVVFLAATHPAVLDSEIATFDVFGVP